MNSIELIKESKKLDEKINKASWIGGACLLFMLGVPLYGTVLLMIAGLIFGFNADKYAGYFVLCIPVGGIFGLMWAIPMSGVRLKRDNLRKQAIKQWGDDEEEY